MEAKTLLQSLTVNQMKANSNKCHLLLNYTEHS